MKNIFLLLSIICSFFLKAQNYIPDSAFGGTGAVVTNYNMYYDNNQAPRNVFFENNKYIFTQKTQLSCFNYDGTVDYTFGTLGYSRIIIPNCPHYTITIKSTKIINNNIFVYGKSYDPSTGLFYGFIAKMTMEGVFDSTFGNNGIVTVTIGYTNNNPLSDGITDLVFKNGNYFGIGTISHQDTNSIFRRNIFTVKLNANGVIDFTNDPTGIKKIISIDGHIAKNIYEHQGDLLIIGHITNNNTGNENSLTILKTNENGDLISTFGIDGVKKIPLSPLGWQTGENFNNCKLIGDDVYVLRTYFIYSYVLQKIQKINITNLVTTDISATNNNSSQLYEIDNDKIYIIGCLTDCQNDFNIIRRNIDGTLDTTFNQTGTYSFDFPTSFGTTYDSPTVLVKHSDNRIFIGGYTSLNGYTSAPQTGFAMIRIVDETLSNDEFTIQDNFYLFPNPVDNILTIENNKNILIEKIVISDISGKVVNVNNGSSKNINIEHLNSGVYFVKLYFENKIENFKIIKK